MSAAAIYNGFGQYETKDGQKGITLTHGGNAFWFPFGEVTYLPDFTLRSLDEAESIFESGDEARLVYKTTRVSGERLAEELLETQVPVKNSEKGLVLLPKNAPKKQTLAKVFCGVDEFGTILYSEVLEVEPREEDIKEAERRALAFKQDTIKTYFQSKRERMAGGAGYFIPTGLIRVFMDELNVKDIDDVFAAKPADGGFEALLQFLQQTVAKGQPTAPVSSAAPVPASVPPPPVAETPKPVFSNLV